MSTILVVEDEKAIADILAYNLEREGYHILVAYDGKKALEIIFDKKPDLVLLDIMLPKVNGFEVCKKVRSQLTTPIIMLTARGDSVDQVLGLELGADDYIKKPFVMKELLARVKANLRRVKMMNSESNLKNSLIEIGDIIIDDEKYEIRMKDKALDLTLREYELIKFLSKIPGKVYTREELLSEVWGYEYFGDLRTVDVTISRLRDKLKLDNNDTSEYIMTKRGRGYYFKVS
ncbi:response regulator [Vallitalea okinawensis]|uniref:response regulator n=1 Tax=Vallitalea okinawensis TaxID=2078660 RepID=UPI000CFA9324|nr:response regulator [Vallitalea okinawensis]